MEGVLGKHILGGASVHIKALDSTQNPQQRNSCTERIMGPISFEYAGENTALASYSYDYGDYS